jgi:proteasome assembly chaperone (PAC2) family protein
MRKFYQRFLDIKHPTMIAGWPGMGSVAIETVDYIRRKLEAELFAEIEMHRFTTANKVIVEDGIVKLPKLPRSLFYYRKHPNLIIFEGEVQVQGVSSVELLQEILDIACEYNVSRIYTAAAFPTPMSYKEVSTVYAVANDKSLRDWIYKCGIKIMEEGEISGLNGLLLGHAQERGIQAICLLATMPIYAINFTYPKAVKAIIEVLKTLLNIRIDTTELDLFILETSKKLAIIEEKLKKAYSQIQIPQEEIVSSSEPATKIPNYIIEKIEKLFQEAKVDKNKAYLLKQELDRWELYKIYEDRFLDLFKKEDQ